MASSQSRLLLFLFVMVFAYAAPKAQPKTLYDQLLSVNQEWKNQADVPAALRSTPAKAFNEQQLIQFHLEQTEMLLRNRNKADLTGAQQKKRQSNLDTLHGYWQAGVFPVNDHYVGKQPYFIDKFNTYCAVGYLMQQSGGDDIAKDINRTQNFSYIIDIDHPHLMDWVMESGLSLDELALIQPAYPDATPTIITEIHYNNTGADVNEYIEVHQGDYPFAPISNFASILFYDHLGILYKTLPIANMQSFTSNGLSYYHYTFPANENLADSGKIELFGNYSQLILDFTYNSSGITENIPDPNPVPGSGMHLQFNLAEDANTPIGSSMIFCSNGAWGDWTASINPATPGLPNPCAVTAMNLFSFNYTTNGKIVQLKWQTASESNTDHYLVERSEDGIHFDAIGNVKAAGNSNSTKSYIFTDDHPNYINHYRLKLVNLDGSVSYSRTLYAKITDANPLSISPNLVGHFLNIKISSTGNIKGSLLVYDFSGRKITELTAKTGSQVIDVATYPAGKYLVRLVTTDRNAYSQVFIKQ